MRLDVRRAERALLGRFQTDRVRHLRAFQRRWRDADPAAVNRLAADESAAARNRDGVRVVRVHEIHIVNVGVKNVRVADERVVYVDDGDEIVAATKPRKERFAEAKREPSASETDPAAEAKASTQEAYESRPIDRRTKERARAPAPPAREIVPATIMVRSKAPRPIGNPSPAPPPDPGLAAGPVTPQTGRTLRLIPNL